MKENPRILGISIMIFDIKNGCYFCCHKLEFFIYKKSFSDIRKYHKIFKWCPIEKASIYDIKNGYFFISKNNFLISKFYRNIIIFDIIKT